MTDWEIERRNLVLQSLTTLLEKEKMEIWVTSPLDGGFKSPPVH
jgi:hypothetical protein